MEEVIELTVIPEVDLYPHGEDFRIYACRPLDESKVKLNKYNNITISGKMPRLEIGKEYKVKLTPTMHKKYGLTYKVNYIHIEVSTTIEQKNNFLKEILPEILAKHLIEAYPNEDIVELIKQDKIAINKVKGLGPITYQKLREKVLNSLEYMEALAHLSEYGLTYNAVKKLVKEYGSAATAIEKVKENPYVLTELDGFGFKTVDGYALNMGIEKDSPYRILSAIEYVLKEAENDGHCWLEVKEVEKEVKKLLGLNYIDVYSLLSENDHKNLLIIEDRICLKRNYVYENKIKDKILELLNSKSDIVVKDKELKINKIEKEQEFKFTEEQKKAIKLAIEKNVLIVSGKAGSGKCINGDSYVFTEKGMIKIKDIPKYFNLDDLDNLNAKVVSYDENGNRYIKETSKWYNMGGSETIKIVTYQGYEIEGTPEHPIIILDKNGQLKFKRLIDVQNDDIVAISKNNNIWGENQIDEDIAYLLGFLIGDGTLTEITKGRNRIIYTKKDKLIYEKINNIIEEKFNCKVHTIHCKKSNMHSVYSKEIVEKLKYLDVPFTQAPHKYIPSSILTSTKQVNIQFLRGLFDTDGSVTRNVVEYSSASKELARQVQLVLLNLGIISNLREKTVKGYKDRKYWVLTISGININKFYEEVGFRFEINKQKKLIELIKTKRNPNNDILYYQQENMKYIHEEFLNAYDWYKKPMYLIPCKSGEKRYILNFRDKRRNGTIGSYAILDVLNTYNLKTEKAKYIRNIAENMFFSKIRKIEKGKSIVYDFTVPETHSFVANGFINHNTTILKGISKAFDENSQSACALSGKAVQRINEVIPKLEAKTIHRLLNYHPEFGFGYDENNPLPYDVVILDEGSMVNNYVFYKLISAIPKGKKLIILGDTEQLPPIGAGNVLKDLIESGVVPVVELTKVHRQALRSGILLVANHIRDGNQIIDKLDFKSKVVGELKDLYLFPKKTSEEIFEHILKSCKAVKDQFDVMDIQVIVPMKNRGLNCTKNLNIELQKIFNPEEKPFLKRGDFIFKEGDKVIRNGNDYDNSIFNGTLGIVQSVDEIKKEITINFIGERVVTYTQEDLKDIDLAYALTCHKCQGSQFKYVILALDFSAFKLLTRQLVYTGLTRSIEKCMFIFENRALRYAIKNNDVSKRNTFLKNLLLEKST